MSGAAGKKEGLVTYKAEGGVGIITLNAPAKLNALTAAMGDELGVLLAGGIDYDQVGALVVTGAGKAFSAGGDFDFLNARAADTGMRNSVIMRGFYQRFLRIREAPVPVIAAINGPAIGAGLCFAMGADMRIASKTAKLGITFVGLGLHPGMGATYFLPRLVGPQLAARMCLTGEVVTGEQAADMGLVLQAVEEAEVLPTAVALAAKVAAQAPVAVRSCVRSLRMAADEGLDRALWREADAQSYCYAGADLKEGVAAVAGKRKAVWRQHEHYRV